MNAHSGTSDRWLRLRYWVGWAVLVFMTSAAFGQTNAATRIALVGSGGNTGVGNTLDLATALLGKDTDLQLLDRAEVDRVLREQTFSLSGIVRAEDAVKAGQLLHVDLFAVLEGTLTNELREYASLGLIVFDAKSGVRYADSALQATNAVSAASAVAAAVRAAVVKSHRSSRDLHTVGLLSVRNADLPRRFDSICDSVGLLLERELTASPGIAVLERRRLEQVNKERGTAPDAEGNRLLSSVRMMQLDISRDGEGLRGTIALIGSDGAQTNKITANVPARDAAALAHQLAEKIEQLLNTSSGNMPVDREAEAMRFHREHLLLTEHNQYLAAVHELDAAIALAPEQRDWQQEMVSSLFGAAIEVIDPGGQRYTELFGKQPSVEDVSTCLVLGQRGTDLLLSLSREATAQAKPGEPVPEVLSYRYRNRLSQLLYKLGEVKNADPASAAEIVSLAGKERTLLIEITEPFLIKRSVDAPSFANYSETIGFWCNGLNQQDALLVMNHWIEMSHKINPHDGGGNYGPLNIWVFQSDHEGSWFAEFIRSLEQDQDPIIRIFARAARVKLTINPNTGGMISDETLAAEREFRRYAQDRLAHDKTAQSGPIRNGLWHSLEETLSMLINHPAVGDEYLETCRFAFAQEDIKPIFFYRAAEVLDRPSSRNSSGELEVVDGALKLIMEHPDAYPKIQGNLYNRTEVIQDLRQKHDRLVAELAGTNANTNAPVVFTWKKSVCLLDLFKPINGYAWVFKPVVQDGQVFATALGVQEWGLPEDSLQLVRVPLTGGAPSFLGRAKFTGLYPNDREYYLSFRNSLPLRYSSETDKLSLSNWTWSFDFVRAACVGAGCYFAATGSGVYIFPTNGGPVLHLGTTNGLPSDDVRAVAFLDGKLYIGAGEFEHSAYVACYEPATHNITVLASSRRSEHLSPLDDQDPFSSLGFVADSARHRLIMALSSGTEASAANNPVILKPMGIWSYSPSTSQFEWLASLRMPVFDPLLWHTEIWFGLTDANTVAVKELNMMALFDLRNDRLISSYDPWVARTNAAIKFWLRPVPGYLGNRRLVDGPFILRDGWIYSARPFERMALADGRREELPPLRTDYPFNPRESLQLLDDGKHVLAADQFSLWLLELKPEPAHASVGSGNDNSAVTGK